MKVFFTIKNINFFAGTERVTALLANELVARGYEIGIISLVGEGKKPFFTFDNRVKLFYLSAPKDHHIFPFRDLRRIRKMKAILRQEKPDCVIFVDSGRSFVNVPASKGIPSITWEHLNIRACNGPKRRLSRVLAVKYTDCIVSLTSGDADDYVTMFGAERSKSLCMPNPITIDNSVKCSLTEKRVLAVGRLDNKQKGFDLLIEAWSKVKNRDGWKLRIIGAGKHERIIRNQIAELGLKDSIEVVPPTKDMISEYLNSSIYAMSSRYEGLPLVLIEAMSLGLPIVSFDCERGPSDIVEDGVTGYLVETFDVDKFAERLQTLISDKDLREKFSKTSIEHSSKFAIDEIITRWEKLIEDVVSGRK